MNHELITRLLQLVELPAERALENDPVSRVHRYTAPADIEVAGFFCAMLAYGRVAAFLPVLDALLDRMDQRGGPASWIDTLDREAERPNFDGWVYRFNRADDLLDVACALQDARERWGSLGAGIQDDPVEPDLGEGMSRWVRSLRASVAERAGWSSFMEATRGHRYFLVDPADGSAAKRLWLYARWMVRPADGVDFGLWTHLRPSRLRIPVDTHVHRIARLTGLIDRKTADGRASRDLTRVLAQLDRDDPVRFDFALAHLGISNGCRGRWDADVCPTCTLLTVCASSSVK